VDETAMTANITAMADFCSRSGVWLRPHTKTHKCPELARRQLAAGALGLTCAKVGEAEALVDAGVQADLLVANEVVGKLKVDRLVRLAARAPLTVGVDDAANVTALGAAASRAGVTLGILVDVDTGMKRCGVAPAEAAGLARRVAQTRGLRFRGVMGYEGHAVFIMDRGERETAARAAMAMLLEARDRIVVSGIGVEVVSAAGSGTYDITGTIPGITEMQAGSYILMDTRYKGVGLPFACALTVLATVISRPVPERAVLDVGLKGITSEFGLPELKGLTGAKVVRLSEEHTILALEPGVTLRPGDRVELIPSHGCTTINLHDRFYAVHGDDVIDQWPITGRGRLQ
jgi:D-serine deaminase-like pyridoxal phosphate-dependent protein